MRDLQLHLGACCPSHLLAYEPRHLRPRSFLAHPRVFWGDVLMITHRTQPQYSYSWFCIGHDAHSTFPGGHSAYRPSNTKHEEGFTRHAEHASCASSCTSGPGQAGSQAHVETRYSSSHCFESILCVLHMYDNGPWAHRDARIENNGMMVSMTITSEEPKLNVDPQTRQDFQSECSIRQI